MGRYNLLDEPWISVLDGVTGEKEDVSMLEFFRKANNYRSLAGEMETQNFAVMRFLLAVIQTVFSRFDFLGNVLPGVDIDDNWVQTEPVDDDDRKEYKEAVSECWKKLYLSGSFPEIVTMYLDKWKDRFYLFDEEHPLYQVNAREMEEIIAKIPKKNQPTAVYGKTLNRTISESENKTALFSPIANIAIGKRSKKDVLTSAELVRWLLTFQGYTGLADKVSLAHSGQRPSKGWLFDLGAIYLRGDNIFETLIMNYMPESPKKSDFIGRVQTPCWEIGGEEMVKRLYEGRNIDNLAELYTNWSRAVYLDPQTDMSRSVKIDIVKLPEIDHSENSIEPMTIWNDNGPNKGHFSPKKHPYEQSLWRSFGIITMKSSMDPNGKNRRPGIFDQYQRLKDDAGSRWTDLVGVSMKDDGNATSWLPADEIVDSFKINDLVITDTDPDGWIIRINDTVETTKYVVSGIFRGYLKGICEVRNMSANSGTKIFIEEETSRLYAAIDSDFKKWLSEIGPTDSKEEKIKSWYKHLRKIVLDRGNDLFENSTERDLKGVETEKGVENIATKYWQFANRVNDMLAKEDRFENGNEGTNSVWDHEGNSESHQQPAGAEKSSGQSR